MLQPSPDHITYHHTSTISRVPPFITLIIPYHFTPTHHYTHPHSHLGMTLRNGDIDYFVTYTYGCTQLLQHIPQVSIINHISQPGSNTCGIKLEQSQHKVKRMKGVQETYDMMNTGGRSLAYNYIFVLSPLLPL